MQAVLTSRYGDETQLELGELASPAIGLKEILIEVKAAGLNPVDWKVLRGDARLFSGWTRPPRILGADFAGLVKQVGPKVPNYQPGDKVFGMVPAFKGGAFAQQIIVTANNIAPMPTHLDFSEAAAMPLVALTAHQFMFQKAQLQPGRHVLINGCTGGLGHIAVQLAKASGATVTGVCSGKNAALAKQLGCDEVIDYRQHDPLTLNGQYDLIFDTASTMRFRTARKRLSPKGAFATALPSLQNLFVAPLLNGLRAQKEHGLWVAPNDKALAHIADSSQTHHIRPHIEQTYPITDIARAIGHSKSGKVRGKLVLTFPAAD
ncbi:NAD(P)-dependent alcohol dehydrogenase [Maritalea mediterranea]|uniref:NAD(P)-dependent alcohol dehydrogenase n=1 Tax=Maritalea mediterranea TaxID=2909667 RepID=A0ABS9EC25_9HYPH|nr:NAD(P)-dependent alcohol dehydrogenase [Maritalea mediterranea]MCF4098973.1 NAD(P)-dependent alcohol dehydrogenase [Maritalea mediterranea]